MEGREQEPFPRESEAARNVGEEMARGRGTEKRYHWRTTRARILA